MHARSHIWTIAAKDSLHQRSAVTQSVENIFYSLLEFAEILHEATTLPYTT